MSSNTFLDVDDEILKKKLILPGNAPDPEFDSILKQFDSKPFFIIQPTPGACIKTKTETGEKIFLNICTSEKIPAPEDISDAQLFSILSEEAPIFTIPMSIGNERLESDKSDSLCFTYDIAINTSYFNKCQKQKNFWLFTISVAMDGVANKFNKTLKTDEYVILKNKKVMGKLQQHRIENREPHGRPMLQKPLIEEISSESKDKPSGSHVPVNSFSQSKSGQLLLRYPAKGTPTLLIGLFEMPKGSISKIVSVLLYTDRIVVEALDNNLMYDIDIPYKVQRGNATSFLDTNLGVLRINMPIENGQGDINV